jgi:hypothetical protein
MRNSCTIVGALTRRTHHLTQIHRADDRSPISVVGWQHATSTCCAGDTEQRFVEPRVLVVLQMRDSECRQKMTVQAC